MKSIRFVGSALFDLRNFPEAARRDAGFQLDKVQHGLEPDDWKPMPGVGAGVQEMRIFDAVGTFRVIYVAKFSDAVYVLHCFQKKTTKTSDRDLLIAEKRFRQIAKDVGP